MRRKHNIHEVNGRPSGCRSRVTPLTCLHVTNLPAWKPGNLRAHVLFASADVSGTPSPSDILPPVLVRVWPIIAAYFILVGFDNVLRKWKI